MQADLIYDVGMGNGDDTAYYLRRRFRVVAIDANPVAVEQASRRFASEIKAGRLSILNVGFCEKEGEIPFWVCDSVPEWSSFGEAIASREGAVCHQIQVFCRSFKSVLAEFGVPYYLKLDIEGREIFCLRDLMGSDELPQYVSFEQNRSSFEALPLLHKLGYTGFKLISQVNYLPVQYPPTRDERYHQRIQALLKSRNPLLRIAKRLGARQLLESQVDRTRRRNDWRFPSGSSGPFAEDTPGRWQGIDEIMATFRSAWDASGAGEPSIFWGLGNPGFWADFHARRES